MILLEDKNREYKRFRPNVSEKIQLANNGLQWVLSSNVSALGTNEDSLIIRFHNGSLYEYPNQAKLFEDMLKSNSKGHFLWVKLRRPKVAYKKIGSLPFKSDIEVTDEEIFSLLENKGMSVYQRLESIGMAIIETPIGVIKTIPISQMNVYDTRVTNTVIDVFEFEQKPAMWDNFKGTNKIEFDETYKVYVEEIKKTDAIVPNDEFRNKTTYFHKNMGKLFPDLKINKAKSTEAFYKAGEGSVTFPSLKSATDLEKTHTSVVIHEFGHAIDYETSKKLLGRNKGLSTGIKMEKKALTKNIKTFAKKLGTNAKDTEAYLNKKIGELDEIVKSYSPEQKELLAASDDFSDSVQKYVGKYNDLRKTDMYKKVVEHKEEYIKVKTLYMKDDEYLEIDKKKKAVFEKLSGPNFQENKIEYERLVREQSKVKKKYNSIVAEFEEKHTYMSQASDTLDALSLGNFQNNGEIYMGHGTKYYKQNVGQSEAEIFTHLTTTSVASPDVYKLYKKDFPEIVESYEKLINKSFEMMKKVVK